MANIIAICTDSSYSAKSSDGTVWNVNDLPNSSALNTKWKSLYGNGNYFMHTVVDMDYPTSIIVNTSTNAGISWSTAVLPLSKVETIIALYPGATKLTYSYNGTIFG